MCLLDIENEISIWDKWSFNWETRQIVCFTLHDLFEDGTAIFKWKHKFACKWTDFFKLIRKEENRKNFTFHTDTFIGKSNTFEEEITTHV